ncbi:class II histocompatibility antigen, B-L beta chain-like, partial [Manacus vitellinus]|uniref:class II histocompatibility antigen, B-L beta chain-like n=1 Tax=Manacus vitellinus TaxID=328815 RepID=UPI00115DB2E3
TAAHGPPNPPAPGLRGGPPTALSNPKRPRRPRPSQRAALMTHQSAGKTPRKKGRATCALSQAKRRPKPPKRHAARAGLGAVRAAVRRLGMERGAGSAGGRAGGRWMVLGAAPRLRARSCGGVFQWMGKAECHFISGTEWVRYVQRYIYNREQYAHFDSDVGVFVGDTPYGEFWARQWNNNPEILEYERGEVDRLCRHNYKLGAPFRVQRRVPPSVSISLVPSSSQPGPGRLLCSGMDFYPAPVQVRWFQDGQELPEHVVATDVVPNGDWTYQVLVLLEIPPRRGVTYSCQVEHVSLEHPLSRHWEMPPDTVRSKILVGVGGFVLGLVFLALGLGFYLREKVKGGPQMGVVSPPFPELSS